MGSSIATGVVALVALLHARATCAAETGPVPSEPSAPASGGDRAAPTRGAIYQLRGEGNCPSVALVEGALAPLLASEPLDQAKPVPVIRLTDLGDRFSVAIGERERTYLDPSRRCEERARVAAIFSALTLRPPSPWVETPVQVPPPPPSPQPLPLATVGRRRVEVGAALATSFAPATPSWGARFALGLLVGDTAWGLEGDLSVLGPTEQRFALARAQLMRVPLGLSAFRYAERGRVGARAGLGAGIDLVRIRGLDLRPGEVSYRINPTLRAELAVVLWPRARVSPIALLQATWAPRTLHLTAAASSPDGRETELGALPHFWLGAGLGLSAQWD